MADSNTKSTRTEDTSDASNLQQRSVSTCSSEFSSCKDTEILTLKSTVSHLKNENFELTENIHRQNMAFISWQKSVDEELAYLQKEILSSRQKKKYENWKQGRRMKNTLEVEAKIEKIEPSLSCGLSSVLSEKIDLDKGDSLECREKGSSVSLDKIHNDRQMLLDLRVQRDQLLSDKEALTIQYANSQLFTNSQHEQITALQDQVEELRQTTLFLMSKMESLEYEKSVNTESDCQRNLQSTINSLEVMNINDSITNDNIVTNNAESTNNFESTN